ncbi:hypothetical protein BKA69DRAFT_1076493 [Paraphysoderma sedebokerense]|nr:hypothetical protein BKA69DRAFT_1076493 [Paraphysoderma sedebokerense]
MSDSETPNFVGLQTSLLRFGVLLLTIISTASAINRLLLIVGTVSPEDACSLTAPSAVALYLPTMRRMTETMEEI